MVLAVLGMCEFIAYWNRFVHFPRDQIAAEFSLVIEAGPIDDRRKLRGVFTDAKGNRYEGEWRDGTMSGHGVATYASGTRYEGAWRDVVPPI